MAERRPVSVTLNGRPVEFTEGELLAIALLKSGLPGFSRGARSGEPRLPFCLMGVCFDCRIEINGRSDSLACMTPVRAGMDIRTAET
jgi:D-hydroxyproline dehydrogenase subunit gamma